jgi:hypothetical protein
MLVAPYFVASRKWLESVSDITYSVEETYVIRSFRSFSFFNPPKAIFVPGMNFFGFSR